MARAGTGYIDILPRFGAQWNQQLASGMQQAGTRAGQQLEQSIGRSTGAVQTRLNQVFSFMSSLGGATSPLGNAFQNLFTNIETGFTKAATSAEESRRRIGAALEGIGVGAIGLGALFEHFAGPLEKAMAAAETAIKNTGQPLDEHKAKFDEAAKAGARYGFSQADVLDALAKLTVATKDPNEALKELNLTETLAAAKHTSVAEAANLVSRAHAGVFRAFKEFGINVKAVTDADAKAEAAAKTHAAALDGLKTSQQNLADFEARLSEKRQAAADEYASKVEAADQRIEDAEQNMDDLRARINDAATQRQEQYADKVESANQRVVDSEESAAAARASASGAVVDALQRLQDLQAVNAAEGDPKLQAQIRQSQQMRDAINAVSEARRRAADVKDSTEDDVAKARAAQAKAVADRPEAVTLSESQQLTNAQQAIDKAVAARADIKVTGGVTLADLQEERKLRDAVTKASEKEKDTADKEAAAKKAAADSQAAFAEVERQFMEKEQGLLEARRKTWSGTLDYLKTRVENFFAGLGEKVSRPLETFGPAALTAGALLRLGGRGRGAAGAAGAAEGAAAGAEQLVLPGIGAAAAGGEAAAAGAAGPLAGIAASAGPIALVVAAVAAVGVAVFEAYKHIKPFHDAVDDLGRGVRDAFGDVERVVKSAWDTTQPIFDFFGRVIKDVVVGEFKVLAFEAKLAWAVVEDIFNAMGVVVRTVVGPAFSWLGDHVIGPVWDKFSKLAAIGWGIVKGIFKEIDDHVRGPLSTAFNTISDVWSTVWDKVTGVVSGAFHTVGSIIAKIIGVVATVADAIGADNVAKALRDAQHALDGNDAAPPAGVLAAAKSVATRLATGGTVGSGFKTNGPQAIVGEGDPRYPEYVIATDPKYRSRNAALVSEMLAQFGMASGGVLGFIEKAGGVVTGGAGSLIDGVTSGLAAIGNVVSSVASRGARWVLEHAWPNLPVSNNLLGLVPAAFNSLRSTALDRLGAGKAPVGGKPSGPVPPGSVHDWIMSAIGLTGVPAAWANSLYEIVMHESGGNPYSSNDWDSNAKAGNPSRGLMQTTLSTFRGNALPGHTNIFDPVDNIAAGIRYILGRYHDISRVPGVVSLAAGQGYKPYAAGGRLTLHTRPFDSGGVLEQGWNLLPNTTGAQERLTPDGVGSDVVSIAEAFVAALHRAGLEVKMDDEKVGVLVSRAQYDRNWAHS